MKNEFLDRLIKLFDEYHDKQAMTGICPCCGMREFKHSENCTFLIIEAEVLKYETEAPVLTVMKNKSATSSTPWGYILYLDGIMIFEQLNKWSDPSDMNDAIANSVKSINADSVDYIEV